jgi:hypothetical protein
MMSWFQREVLKTGLNIAGDVVHGRNIKQAAKSRLKSTGENLLQKAIDTVGSQDNGSIPVIHDICFHKQVSISQVDIVVPAPLTANSCP